MINTIIQGDCLDVIKQIDTESIDMVFTDPPYGDGIGYGREGKEILNNEDESINYKIIPELSRVTKKGGVIAIFTNWKFLGKLQAFIESETDLYQRMVVVMVKNNIGMGYGFRNQYELLLVLEKGKHKYEDAGFSNVIYMENINHTTETHPHEKGIEMLARVIKHCTNENDLILDCFAGSGSICVSAQLCNRRFIGIELDPKWFAFAKDRLDLQKPDVLLF